MATEVNQTKLLQLVKDGATLPKAAEKLGLPVSVVGPHFYKAEVVASPRLKLKNPTPKAIRELRDKQNLRWERIAARTNMSVAAVKAAYEEAGGDLNSSYTGKGIKPGGARKTAGTGRANRKQSPASGTRKKTTGRKGGSSSKKTTGRKGTVTRRRTRAARAAGNPS